MYTYLHILSESDSYGWIRRREGWNSSVWRANIRDLVCVCLCTPTQAQRALCQTREETHSMCSLVLVPSVTGCRFGMHGAKKFSKVKLKVNYKNNDRINDYLCSKQWALLVAFKNQRYLFIFCSEFILEPCLTLSKKWKIPGGEAGVFTTENPKGWWAKAKSQDKKHKGQ